MDNKQSIEQLKSLMENQKKFIDDMEDPNNVDFVKNVEALNIAINALERTALEVPVQEQLIENIVERVLLNAIRRFIKCI